MTTRVGSNDGTEIACERTGSGPPLVLVDGAFCSRAFGPMRKLAALLASHFTVTLYDRRGRGESGDTPQYAREREIEDLDAVIRGAGGRAYVVGMSSGAALALEGAASGLDLKALVAYEPPHVDSASIFAAHEARLRDLVAAGKRGAAVAYFMRDMMGIPGAFVALMRLMPWLWPKLKAVAHTLPYDAALMGGFQVPSPRFAQVAARTLLVHGSKTDPRLATGARAVAAAVPGAELRVLAGQTHNVDVAALAPVVVEFFRA